MLRIVSGHRQRHCDQHVLNLESLAVVIDLLIWLMQLHVPVHRLLPLSTVALAIEAPVMTGQQAIGVLVGVDPRRCHPGRFEHRDRLVLHAEQGKRLRLVSFRIEEQRIARAGWAAELLLEAADLRLEHRHLALIEPDCLTVASDDLRVAKLEGQADQLRSRRAMPPAVLRPDLLAESRQAEQMTKHGIRVQPAVRRHQEHIGDRHQRRVIVQPERPRDRPLPRLRQILIVPCHQSRIQRRQEHHRAGTDIDPRAAQHAEPFPQRIDRRTIIRHPDLSASPQLALRGDLSRCLIVVRGGLVDQWQDELHDKFGLRFEILTADLVSATPPSESPFAEHPRLIARMDQLARNDALLEHLRGTDWDVVIVDEAHRMAAHYFGGELKTTRRYQLGQLLGGVARHLLLMTATPHAGKEEDFQLFLALLDPDRYEGRYR